MRGALSSRVGFWSLFGVGWGVRGCAGTTEKCKTRQEQHTKQADQNRNEERGGKISQRNAPGDNVTFVFFKCRGVYRRLRAFCACLLLQRTL